MARLLFTYDLINPITIYHEHDAIEVKTIEVYEPTMGYMQQSEDSPLGILQEIGQGDLLNITKKEIISKADMGGESDMILLQSIKDISGASYGKQDARLTEAYKKIFFSIDENRQTLVKIANQHISLQAKEASDFGANDWYNIKKKINSYFLEILNSYLE